MEGIRDMEGIGDMEDMGWTLSKAMCAQNHMHDLYPSPCIYYKKNGICNYKLEVRPILKHLVYSNIFCLYIHLLLLSQWNAHKPAPQSGMWTSPVSCRHRTSNDDSGSVCTQLNSSLVPAPMAWRGWSRLLGL